MSPLTPEREDMIRQCEKQAEQYQKEAREWEIPAE